MWGEPQHIVQASSPVILLGLQLLAVCSSSQWMNDFLDKFTFPSLLDLSLGVNYPFPVHIKESDLLECLKACSWLKAWIAHVSVTWYWRGWLSGGVMIYVRGWKVSRLNTLASLRLMGCLQRCWNRDIRLLTCEAHGRILTSRWVIQKWWRNNHKSALYSSRG